MRLLTLTLADSYECGAGRGDPGRRARVHEGGGREAQHDREDGAEGRRGALSSRASEVLSDVPGVRAVRNDLNYEPRSSSIAPAGRK